MKLTDSSDQHSTFQPRYVSLKDAAHRLRMSFARTLALVRANQLRARLVDGHYWIAAHELRRFRLRMSRQGAPGSTIGTRDVSRDGGRAA